MKLSPQQERSLRIGIIDCFSLDELKTLSRDLGFLYEDIEGETITAKARGIITYLERRGLLQDLINYCVQNRPNYEWLKNLSVQALQPAENKANKENEKIFDYESQPKQFSKQQLDKIVLESSLDTAIHTLSNKKREEYLKDCLQLKELLVLKDWKTADDETAKIIIQISQRKDDGWIKSNDIKNFPCEALWLIDDLWFKLSEERFGFSAQRTVWNQIGGQPGKFDPSLFRKFGEQVGWRNNSKWLKTHDEFSFTLSAPIGHLPTLRLLSPQTGTRQWSSWRGKFELFLLRAEDCLKIHS